MKKSSLGTQPPARNSSGDLSAMRVMLDFVDTAWRIAVPVVLFAGIGIFADIKFETEPWLTLLGAIVGFIFAGLLVKGQLQRAMISDQKSAEESKDV